MKKLMSFVCAALFAFSFCAVMPSNAFSADPNRQEVEKRFELNSATAEELAGTGAVSLEVAKKIVELRDQLGSFQSYDDLNELELPKDQMDKLRWNTTIPFPGPACAGPLPSQTLSVPSNPCSQPFPTQIFGRSHVMEMPRPPAVRTAYPPLAGSRPVRASPSRFPGTASWPDARGRFPEACP